MVFFGKEKGWRPWGLHLCLLLTFFAPLCGGVLADEEAPVVEEWRYRLAPGENIWDFAARYLLDPQQWKALLAYNGIDDPRRLPVGAEVRIPLAWLKRQPVGVKVVERRGEVTWLPARRAARPLDEGAEIHAGDRIVVGKEGHLLLEFDDGSRTVLGPGTSIYFRRVNRISGGGQSEIAVEVERGRLDTRVPPHQGTRFEIRTPAANAAVRGTRYRVALDARDPRLTRVGVDRGAVAVANPNGAIELPEGFGTSVLPDQPPKPPKPLLPPPSFLSPQGPLRRLPALIAWRPQPQARGYHVQVLPAEGDEQAPLLDRRTTETRLDVSALPDGAYRVSLRAIDADGLEGLEGQGRFDLDARPVPPLPGSPPPPDVVRATPVRLTWTTPPAADGYRVQVARDEAFDQLQLERTTQATELILEELPEGHWHWRVASLWKGEQGPWSLPARFERRAMPEAPAVGAEVEENRLRLRWPASRPSQRSRVQFASDTQLPELVFDRVVDEPELRLERPTQISWFRVRVVEADGYEGPWSPVQQLFPEPEPWYLFGVPALFIMLLAL